MRTTAPWLAIAIVSLLSNPAVALETGATPLDPDESADVPVERARGPLVFGALFDADADGVGDRRDACPATAFRHPVDTLGCPAVPERLAVLHYEIDAPIELSPAQRARLTALAVTLRQHADIQVLIEGHTDDRGEPEANAELSRRWAEACAEYVGRLGVARGRLHVAGRGETEPRASGGSAHARDLNRRIEIRRLTRTL